MNGADYKEIKEQLKKDLKVVGYRLVDNEEHDKLFHYLDEYETDEQEEEQSNVWQIKKLPNKTVFHKGMWAIENHLNNQDVFEVYKYNELVIKLPTYGRARKFVKSKEQERERERQQAVEQNGNTGVHYLADLDNWVADVCDIRNGDFYITLDVCRLTLYAAPKGGFSPAKLGTFQNLGQAIKRAQDYLLDGE